VNFFALGDALENSKCTATEHENKIIVGYDDDVQSRTAMARH
jgi:hypothetical protein